MSSNVRNQKVRGLADLRTIAGCTNHLAESHKLYLRIAILELEKARRSVEHLHILQRGQRLEKRFREIDAEKRRLFEAMSMQDTSLNELRPAHQARVAAAQRIARRKAAAAKRKADGQQRRTAGAEEQRLRETEAARKRGSRQPRQGFRLRY